MTINDVEKLIKVFEHASITSMDLELDNLKLKLTKSENQVVKEVISDTKDEIKEDYNSLYVKSPLVGSYHEAPYVGGKPFVTIGQSVKKGDKLCIIEAMKVMNEITSPYDGVVKDILLQEGFMVEYDQVLFVIGE